MTGLGWPVETSRWIVPSELLRGRLSDHKEGMEIISANSKLASWLTVISCRLASIIKFLLGYYLSYYIATINVLDVVGELQNVNGEKIICSKFECIDKWNVDPQNFEITPFEDVAKVCYHSVAYKLLSAKGAAPGIGEHQLFWEEEEMLKLVVDN